MPTEPSRKRAAFHEAGHAIVGTQIYGDGFVIKIRMTGGDSRTETRIEEMGNDPQRLWRGDRLADISMPDSIDCADAVGAFCLAGMAADWVAHESYQPSPPDVRSLNTALNTITHPWTLIEPDAASFDDGLLGNSPYAGWFRDARDLLTAHRATLDEVADWLMKIDTLQGPEVEAIIRGERIRT